MVLIQEGASTPNTLVLGEHGIYIVHVVHLVLLGYKPLLGEGLGPIGFGKRVRVCRVRYYGILYHFVREVHLSLLRRVYYARVVWVYVRVVQVGKGGLQSYHLGSVVQVRVVLVGHATLAAGSAVVEDLLAWVLPDNDVYLLSVLSFIGSDFIWEPGIILPANSSLESVIYAHRIDVLYSIRLGMDLVESLVAHFLHTLIRILTSIGQLWLPEVGLAPLSMPLLALNWLIAHLGTGPICIDSLEERRAVLLGHVPSLLPLGLLDSHYVSRFVFLYKLLIIL